MVHEWHAIKSKTNVRMECFCALWKVQNEATPTVPPEGQTEEWMALKPSVKAASVHKWALSSQESIWESGGGEVGDGAGKQVMKCEMCTENDEGSGCERQSQ
jgi:hypothetical protein